jgi:Uma2 family endonuclease
MEACDVGKTARESTDLSDEVLDRLLDARKMTQI